MRFQSFKDLTGYYAEMTPDAPALIFEEEGEARPLSFSALKENISRRAAELSEMSGGGIHCAGILCDGSLSCAIDIFAAAEAGFQIVMLDAAASEGILKEQIALSDADLLLGGGRCETLPKREGARPELKAGRVLFFTSGTTRSARAVALSEASLCCSAWNGGSLLPLYPWDRLLLMLPLSHVFGFVCGLLWPLSCGASAALGRGPAHYKDDMAFFKPTAVSLVPLLLGYLLKNGLVNDELKLMLVGAGDCPAPVLKAARAKGIRVCFGYGLTETSSGVALSLGEDPYAMKICPDDEIRTDEDGEILIKAPGCVMEGYYKDPEGTAKAFKDGWLRTGDLGFVRNDGKLWITGRKKDIFVLTDGTKVSLPGYEADLAALLPGKDLALFMKDGAVCLAVAGEADERKVADAVAPLMKTLPEGQQVKKVYAVEGIPRTSTGKVMRWALLEMVNGK